VITELATRLGRGERLTAESLAVFEARRIHRAL